MTKSRSLHFRSFFRNDWSACVAFQDMDTRALKPLSNALDGGYRYRSHDMMRHFVTGLFSLWGLPGFEAVPDDAQPQIREAIDAYSKLVVAQEPFTDVLGPLYMDLASRGGRAHMGQYFTPQEVADMMNVMTLGAPPPDGDELITAIDPTCGSGVMMLSFAGQVLKQWGKAYLRRISLTGIDLDPICARMMAAQLVANCAAHDFQLGEFVVLRGNSLFPDRGMELIVHATAPERTQELPALHPSRLKAVAEATAAHPSSHQLALFEAT